MGKAIVWQEGALVDDSIFAGTSQNGFATVYADAYTRWLTAPLVRTDC
jgi:hypothetical protein